MSNIHEFIAVRNAGRLSPWQELDKGLFGKRTHVRALDDTDDCLMVVRGRAPNVVWCVSSLDVEPTYIYAVGSALDHDAAMKAADAALDAIDIDVTETYCPVVNDSLRALLASCDLSDDALLHTLDDDNPVDDGDMDGDDASAG